MASTSLHVIQGSRSSDAFQAAGQKAAAALVHYESAPQPEVVQQGQEPQQLLAALGCSDTDNWQPQNCEAYDEDFQVVHALPDCSIAVGSLPFAAYAFAFSAFCALPCLPFGLCLVCLLPPLPFAFSASPSSRMLVHLDLHRHIFICQYEECGSHSDIASSHQCSLLPVVLIAAES